MIFCDWDELDEMHIMEIRVKCSEIIEECNIETFNKESIHKHIDSGLDGNTLIELDENLSPQPSVANEWIVSENGL